MKTKTVLLLNSGKGNICEYTVSTNLENVLILNKIKEEAQTAIQ
jgi:hypothetical protein